MKLLLLVLVVSIVLSVLFAQSKTSAMGFYDDPDQMEQEILHYVPVATPIDVAKKKLEQYGFKCEYLKNQTFSEVRYDRNAPGRIRQTLYKNKDFLYCDISKGFVVVRRWQASLLFKNSLVTEVSVSTGLIGL